MLYSGPCREQTLQEHHQTSSTAGDVLSLKEISLKHSVEIQCIALKAAEMEEELGSGKARPNTVNLGGGDSDGEGVEEEDDDLEMTKYDEGEVAVNEEDELAVSVRVHWKEVMSKYLK